ncbi:MAG: DUF3078 domain-containing protein, partial [Daejeonella sp.]
MLIRYLIVILLVLSQAFGVNAQESGKESDTTIVKGLKQYPRKNILPVRRPVIFPEIVTLVETTPLDISVNYWRSLSSFGININQATFSDNWGGGGVNSLALGGLFTNKTDYTRGDKNFVSEILLQYG